MLPLSPTPPISLPGAEVPGHTKQTLGKTEGALL